MAMVILLVLLIIFAIIGVPLAFAIGAACITYIETFSPNFISMIPQRIWNGTFSELMIAMPLFMLAGELMNVGGITDRLMNFCTVLVHPINGGLGEVNVVASMIFGGISGSSVADTSALGSIEIPAMEDAGYPSGTAAGITVASSTMGMIIPPSTPMIVYSMISGGSVGALFMAGAIPGILIGITQLILVYILSEKNHWHPKKTKISGKEVKQALFEGLPALLLPLFIIICVSGGVCTASESAGVAVLYSLIIGFFIYHELTWAKIWAALKKSFIQSSSIMIIIGFTTIFTWVLTMQGVPQMVAAFFEGLNLPRFCVAIIFVLLILMIGTFIDVSPAILLLTPILLPVMHAYGFSTLQFGAIIITGLAIGLVTPPVGMCLNACNKINGMPVIEIFRHALPYITCNIVVLVAIAIFEPLTTWLPLMLGYSLN
ncbi:TRAP transporter large permease [Oribacterium sp. WCC10]|uniref:TRAP transporter large permease n=1 Tax=Oribacterium sp. WCC10 TaxID=1855343 RepID=UPI0008E1953D|nr:TRAP transporter large permease [Oribacterium sp. WCC10]SFG09133.1 TRAP transporter, DctM subunit [Oribacterium sp. WCC10]